METAETGREEPYAPWLSQNQNPLRPTVNKAKEAAKRFHGRAFTPELRSALTVDDSTGERQMDFVNPNIGRIIASGSRTEAWQDASATSASQKRHDRTDGLGLDKKTTEDVRDDAEMDEIKALSARFRALSSSLRKQYTDASSLTPRTVSLPEGVTLRESLGQCIARKKRATWADDDETLEEGHFPIASSSLLSGKQSYSVPKKTVERSTINGTGVVTTPVVATSAVNGGRWGLIALGESSIENGPSQSDSVIMKPIELANHEPSDGTSLFERFRRKDSESDTRRIEAEDEDRLGANVPFLSSSLVGSRRDTSTTADATLEHVPEHATTAESVLEEKALREQENDSTVLGGEAKPSEHEHSVCDNNTRKQASFAVLQSLVDTKLDDLPTGERRSSRRGKATQMQTRREDALAFLDREIEEDRRRLGLMGRPPEPVSPKKFVESLRSRAERTLQHTFVSFVSIHDEASNKGGNMLL